jgi:hypothetical protein
MDEMNAAALPNYEIKLSEAETQYYTTMNQLGKLALIGAGIVGGFKDTSELHVLKYNQAMASPDKDKWEKAADEEHGCMVAKQYGKQYKETKCQQIKR